MSSNTTYLLCKFSLNMSGTKVDSKGPSSAMFAVFMSIIVAIALLSPVAVVGNGLVLAAIWRNPALRTPSYILLAGLAITDFCTGLITQPLYIANELTNLLEPSKDYSMTLAIGFLCFEYFGNLSILTVTVMSIERWLHMHGSAIFSECASRSSYSGSTVALTNPLSCAPFQQRF